LNNTLLAKTLFTNKLATREQIERYWAQATEERNIAELLRDAGLLDAAICEQVLEFVRRMEAPVAEPAAAVPSPAPASVPHTIEDDDDLPVERPLAGASVAAVAPIQENPSAEERSSDIPEETAAVLLTELNPGVATSQDVPITDSVVLSIEGNNPYGSMLGAGQVVPVLNGLESNKIAEAIETDVVTTVVEIADSLPQRYVVNAGSGVPADLAPRTVDSASNLVQLVAFARQKFATDLYLQPGMPILLRKAGRLLMASESIPSMTDIERWIGESAAGHANGLAPAMGTGSCRALGLPGLGRVRMVVEWSAESALVSLRMVPTQSMSLSELGLPNFCTEWTGGAGGLVLIAGGASSGRSTTLAAFGQHLIKQRSVHMQTVENPIECILSAGKGVLVQKEVGLHVKSSLQGIADAHLDAPDVFLFDGLRTHDELSGLLQLANSGTLVIATTTGNSGLGLFMRLFDSCPMDQRDLLRNQIAELLRGVICQHLIPHQAGAGMVLAVEAFKVTPGISSLIRKNDLQQLPSAVAGLKNQGIALDDSLNHLLETSQITGAEAWTRALDSRRFQQHRPQNRRK